MGMKLRHFGKYSYLLLYHKRRSFELAEETKRSCCDEMVKEISNNSHSKFIRLNLGALKHFHQDNLPVIRKANPKVWVTTALFEYTVRIKDITAFWKEVKCSNVT